MVYSNNAAERTVHRIRAAAGDAMRYTFFAMRCEMLWSAAKILRAISAVNEGRVTAVGMEGVGDIGSGSGIGTRTGASRFICKHHNTPLYCKLNVSCSSDNSFYPPTHHIPSPPLLVGLDSPPEESLSPCKRLELASFWAKELRSAVAEGLTVRTLMVLYTPHRIKKTNIASYNCHVSRY